MPHPPHALSADALSADIISSSSFAGEDTCSWRRRVRWLLFALTLLGAGFALGSLGTHLLKSKTCADHTLPLAGERCKSGPWGELYRQTFTIAAPDEVLPVHRIMTEGTRWFFPGLSADDWKRFVASLGLDSATADALTAPAVVEARQGGLGVAPPVDALFDLPQKARVTLYQRVVQAAENRSEVYFIHRDTLSDRFGDGSVSDHAMELFDQLSVDHGDYKVLAGLPALLSKLDSYDERKAFVKGLTRQRTLMLRLRLDAQTDINALTTYWSRGCWGTDARTILESVAKIPGGSMMNILMLLPPLPASQLYFYPVVQDNPLNGPPVIRDCHWTSLNFFRDAPDPKLADRAMVAEKLRSDYFPISGDPRYGDLALFSLPNGDVIHSAVFIADDILFTKNGSTAIYPWMLATIDDMLRQYSFQAPEGAKLTVTYYRNKGV